MRCMRPARRALCLPIAPAWRLCVVLSRGSSPSSPRSADAQARPCTSSPLVPSAFHRWLRRLFTTSWASTAPSRATPSATRPPPARFGLGSRSRTSSPRAAGVPTRRTGRGTSARPPWLATPPPPLDRRTLRCRSLFLFGATLPALRGGLLAPRHVAGAAAAAAPAAFDASLVLVAARPRLAFPASLVRSGLPLPFGVPPLASLLRSLCWAGGVVDQPTANCKFG